MEAKEKAKELIRHFKGRGMDGDENYASKECALIVVDEILDSHYKLMTGINPTTYRFWQEVKQEIINL